MLKNWQNIIFIFSAITLLSSCNGSTLYEKHMELEKNKWAFSEPFKSEFDLQLADTVDININITHTDDYPYENIYLRLTQNLGKYEKVDTITFNLSDKYGHWKGNKTWGDGYNYSFSYLKNCHISRKHNSLKIEQFTRNDTLKGLNKIGITIEKSSNKFEK